MAAALTKAEAYSIYDMRRIENMLKNNVENILPEKDGPEQLKLTEPRFLRDSLSFNHYTKE